MSLNHTRSPRRTTRWLATVAAIVVAFFATTGIAAAVEANNADQSQLETVKGIGPSLSSKILAARKQSAFRDWSDLQTRVSGVGEKNSAGFSRNGLTVAGKPKDGADAAPGSGSGRASKASSSKKGGADVAVATAGTGAKKSP
jgi:competence protein ComEA